MQSERMENDQALEHLQTIRTLMERSAVYRRALAPIMVWNGIIGLAAGIAGWVLHLHFGRQFIAFWSGTALLAIVGSFLLVRRQALKESEPFWSPPTRRIAQALLPPLFVGGFLNSIVVYWISGSPDNDIAKPLIISWLLLYGCAAHAAGFFMVRGIKFFGWVFILMGCAILMANAEWSNSGSPYLLMGATFGGLHLAYGIYLYITEKGKNAT